MGALGDQCKYFEVTIVQLNSAGAGVTVGLGAGKVLDKRPGLSARTIGYSSDGLLFNGGPATSQRYGGR